MENIIKKNEKNNLELDLSGLDDSQTAAVTSDASKVLLRAPAGSGKTTSIIHAIVAYRCENLNDRICAITYTRAARAEMESRLQEYGIFDVEVTTIHVWARNLLNDFSIKYDFKIHILEEPTIKAILKDIIDDYLKTSRLKSINIDIVYSYIMGNKNMDVSDKYRATLQALERRYIAYKRLNCLYDFTDYPLYLYDVLTAYNESINNIDALFVDEFQDVDETQLKIFEKVNARKKFAVGDAWQSIFIFRGADGEVFNKVEDFEEYKLKYNYRRPMILCRTNKQVQAINKLGYFECSTVHQAKGLEYDNVVVIDTVITDMESLNVAYVALTRAKNRMLVINWMQFEEMFEDALAKGIVK